MAITVKSPHNGRPVRVRPQDVGRAVRDADGRVFFVLERAGGNGYYGSRTRVGGEAEEQRVDELPESAAAERDDAPADDDATTHDATGRTRSRGRPLLIVVILLLLVALAGYLLSPWGPYEWKRNDPVPPPPAINEDAPSP